MVLPAREGSNQRGLKLPDTQIKCGNALVVESNVDGSSAICRHLSSLGYSVTAVASGVDAVVAARKSPPAIIFLAVQLRDATAAELVTWLRSNAMLLTVPIVVMHFSDEDAPELKAGGFSARLRKPVSIMKVVQAIKDAQIAQG